MLGRLRERKMGYCWLTNETRLIDSYLTYPTTVSGCLDTEILIVGPDAEDIFLNSLVSMPQPKLVYY